MHPPPFTLSAERDIFAFPVNKQRSNNVVTTSLQLRDVVTTLCVCWVLSHWGQLLNWNVGSLQHSFECKLHLRKISDTVGRQLPVCWSCISMQSTWYSLHRGDNCCGFLYTNPVLKSTLFQHAESRVSLSITVFDSITAPCAKGFQIYW